MRTKKKEKRILLPDPVYNSTAVSKFANNIMKGGKKSVARRVIYDAFGIIKSKKSDPLEVFDLALKNVGPSLEVKSKRIGGANYQVPRPVAKDRKVALAMRWIINAARSKKGKPFGERLAEELVLASKNEGAAVKKKNDTHRMAEANRAFAHFGW